MEKFNSDKINNNIICKDGVNFITEINFITILA